MCKSKKPLGAVSRVLNKRTMVETARGPGWDAIGVHVYDGSEPDAFLVDDGESVWLAVDDDQALVQLARERIEAGTLDSSGWNEDEVRALLEHIEAEHHQAEGEDPGPGEARAEPVTRPKDIRGRLPLLEAVPHQPLRREPRNGRKSSPDPEGFSRAHSE